jgi:hypothetical protein
MIFGQVYIPIPLVSTTATGLDQCNPCGRPHHPTPPADDGARVGCVRLDRHAIAPRAVP